ncbi:hypothetical protein IU449_23235 [Nocardia higoensis]|uniref:Uncharacterized protein n=1 Tax=Nocardia higoensis TaxID=228599 RepID=A0ABS0DG23_9NOCA|nr:hypothetical protein [Nocardia higoensis]MBF6357426.1 hypothetical protein [Nocardia higoensis]
MSLLHAVVDIDTVALGRDNSDRDVRGYCSACLNAPSAVVTAASSLTLFDLPVTAEQTLPGGPSAQFDLAS